VRGRRERGSEDEREEGDSEEEDREEGGREIMRKWMERNEREVVRRIERKEGERQ
jgi:hypothetical protein